MRRFLSVLLIAAALVCLCSCRSSDKDSDNVTLQSSDADAIDIDLTQMSSTVVYSEVYNMMQHPDEYQNKTVKMTGLFSAVDGENRRYYTCIITDATACCRQGVEFSIKDDLKYPDDYPEIGDSITVAGTFETYIEDGSKFFQLNNASFVD